MQYIEDKINSMTFAGKQCSSQLYDDEYIVCWDLSGWLFITSIVKKKRRFFPAYKVFNGESKKFGISLTKGDEITLSKKETIAYFQNAMREYLESEHEWND